MDYARVAQTLAAFFAGGDHPFAVVGGFALHGYGLSRTTFDLDFATDASVQDELVAFLESLGYETLYRSPGYSNHLHSRPELGRVDVVYLRGDTSEEVFAGCRVLPVVSGLELPVPRPEHLIAMKLHALANDPSRRRQELVDLAFLVNVDGLDQREVELQFAKRGFAEEYRDLRREA